jgi:hypothetical protein
VTSVVSAGQRRPAAYSHGSLDDIPIDVGQARFDIGYAQRAVIVHQGQDWPGGRFCQNCHGRWPCRMCRWGVRVLLLGGWSHDDIRHLVARARAGELPWS